MESEIPPTVPIRLKVEINCYEHFDVLGLVKKPFSVENSWFTGQAELTTYQFNELLGTKMRALYQRRKGRDLFDLYVGLTKGQFDADEIIQCYNRYMAFTVENLPTYKQFVNNMEAKMTDEEFLGDTMGLLRPEMSFEPLASYQLVKETLIDRFNPFLLLQPVNQGFLHNLVGCGGVKRQFGTKQAHGITQKLLVVQFGFHVIHKLFVSRRILYDKCHVTIIA